MSRKNEIKKDLWKILKSIYKMSEYSEITDKQNHLLDEIVKYLDESISLRRKGEKKVEVEDDSPLERPIAPIMPTPLTTVVVTKRPGSNKVTVTEVKVEPKASSNINIDALPASLRKYVKS